jgi:ubiquinone/menaquinone biosynthesis C-methylase UbiE
MNHSTQLAWKQFWETTAESTDPLSAIDLPEITQKTYKAASVRINQLLSLSAHDSVLNIGCGPGLFEEQFAASVSCIVGIDFSYTMVDKARRLNWEAGNAAFYQASGTALPFKDHQFTKILCYSVLHYLSEVDVILLFKEIRRVSASGTLVLLGDVQDESPSSTDSSFDRVVEIWSAGGLKKLVHRGTIRVRNEVHRRASRLRRKWQTYTGQYVVATKPHRLFSYSRDRLLALAAEESYEGWVVEQQDERFVPGRYHLVLRLAN